MMTLNPQVIPGQQNTILAFLSPYLMGGHVGANLRTGASPAPPMVKEDYHVSSFNCLDRLDLQGYDTDPDLLWKREVQEGTLPQHGLQNFDHFCRFGSHESGHKVEKFVHKAVLQVGQISDETPGGTNRSK